MAINDLVIYWHRFGLKVYRLNPTPIIIKEIDSADPVEIEKQLKFIGGNKAYLLISDSISYLYSKDFSPPLPLDTHLRESILSQIKADIPEDFSSFLWDFKVETNISGSQRITIFAPIKEFQGLISDISQKLIITFVAIEPESISSTRDPSPIIGITKKNDIVGKDEEVLNISLEPVIVKKTNPLPIFLVIFLISNLIAGWFYYQNISIKKNTVELKPTPTISVSPTATAIVTIKKLSELTVLIQNGTNKSGFASTKAVGLKENGIQNIEVGNADTDTYKLTKLIFKDQQLKDKYLKELTAVISVVDSNVSIDTNQTFDVKFILGIN